MVKKKSESEKLSEVVINGIIEKKGKEILVMDLRDIHNSVSDFFIICHGTSNTHVEAIVDSVEHVVRTALGNKPWKKEGLQNAEWILIDFVDVVVHVFLEPSRKFYSLEDLWADAKITRVEFENN